MRYFLFAVSSALASLTLCADEIHFFGGGDFSEKGIYGYGTGAFSPGRGTAVTWEEKEGFMRISLKGGAAEGRAGIRFFNTARNPAGLNFHLRMRMRGKGKVEFERTGTGIRSGWVELTPTWEVRHLFLDGSRSNDASFDRMNLLLKGEGGFVELDDLTVTVNAFDGLIVPPVGALAVRLGENVPAQTFRVYPRDLRGRFLFSEPGALTAPSEFPAAAEGGEVVFPGFKAEKEGFYRVTFTTGGVSAMRDVAVMPERELAALEDAAKKVDLKGKRLRILYLADSLTDFERDHNHAAITAGMLEKFNPGRVTFRNAGIGGDLSRYVQWRLNVSGIRQKVMRRYMYDEILHESYDIIFISLGQNDTVTFPSSRYKDAQLPVKWVDRDLRAVVTSLKRNTGARVVLVSGFSTPVNLNKAFRFGVPELVEAYNACAEKAAEDLGAEYFDIYNILKVFGDEEKRKFFNADLVHLSPAGHRFVALKYLEYLGR